MGQRHTRVFILNKQPNHNSIPDLIKDAKDFQFSIFKDTEELISEYEHRKPSALVYFAPSLNGVHLSEITIKDSEYLVSQHSPLEVPTLVVCDKKQETRYLSDGHFNHRVEFLFPPVSPDYLTEKLRGHIKKGHRQAEDSYNQWRYEELEKQKAFLEDKVRKAQSMAMLGELSSGVVHDVNNVLGVILGTAEIAHYRFGKLNPTLEKYLSTIISITKRAGIFNKRMLSLSKGGRPKIVEFDFQLLLDEVLELLYHTIPKKFQIKRDLQADCVTLKGDPALIQNIVINITFNARDAMPNGGEICYSTRNVRLHIPEVDHFNNQIPSGPYLELVIKDNGIGMNSETLKKIFQPFYTTKADGKGTGLGLSNVVKNARDQKAGLYVSSELGGGTSFRFLFPVVGDVPATEADGSRRLPKGQGKLLIVDDEKDLLEILQEMLVESGYDVVSVSDGMEALNYYKQHPGELDLVVVDMNLPKLTGKECFRYLKQMDPNVKVLLSTGLSLNEDAEDLIREGVSGFIQKPFELSQFLDIIEKIIH